MLEENDLVGGHMVRQSVDRIPCFSFFFIHPMHYIRPSFSLSLLVVTQTRGRIDGRLFSPLPTTARALHFYRDKTSILSSLVDSRRIAPTYARRSQWLMLFIIAVRCIKYLFFQTKKQSSAVSSPARSDLNFASCEIHQSRVSYVPGEGPQAGDSPGCFQGQ